MENTNLIRLTNRIGYNEINNLIGRLPEKAGITQQDYRNCDFEIKKQEVLYLASLFNSELEILKKEIIAKGIKASEKWYVNNNFFKAQTLLHSYFAFLRSYIENVVDFIVLYLKDLQERDVVVGKIERGDKGRFKNLSRLNIGEKDLEKIASIRNAKFHGNNMDYTLAFNAISKNDLEFCLIGTEYKELKPPVEKEVLYYKDLVEVCEIASQIPQKFSTYIDDLLSIT
ncbi:hypothetical protein N9W34_04590 [Rickettsiales bacterium]|nr:hypothetical protein [Rickettsiales bacterium]